MPEAELDYIVERELVFENPYMQRPPGVPPTQKVLGRDVRAVGPYGVEVVFGGRGDGAARYRILVPWHLVRSLSYHDQDFSMRRQINPT